MRQELVEEYQSDATGMPTGGHTTGMGIDIRWQNGPLGRGAERKDPNGAFVEGVIQAAIGRLKYFQGSRFACEENATAITKLEGALYWLEARSDRRERAGVEGTHQV